MKADRDAYRDVVRAQHVAARLARERDLRRQPQLGARMRFDHAPRLRGAGDRRRQHVERVRRDAQSGRELARERDGTDRDVLADDELRRAERATGVGERHRRARRGIGDGERGAIDDVGEVGFAADVKVTAPAEHHANAHARGRDRARADDVIRRERAIGLRAVRVGRNDPRIEVQHDRADLEPERADVRPPTEPPALLEPDDGRRLVTVTRACGRGERGEREHDDDRSHGHTQCSARGWDLSMPPMSTQTLTIGTVSAS